jgi:hypothetical protein
MPTTTKACSALRRDTTIGPDTQVLLNFGSYIEIERFRPSLRHDGKQHNRDFTPPIWGAAVREFVAFAAPILQVKERTNVINRPRTKSRMRRRNA